jgi:hypothetical protein
MSKSKTSDIHDVRLACQSIGDQLKQTYESSKDLKAAQTALSAYSKAISAIKVQILYKKLTGSPSSIDCLN